MTRSPSTDQGRQGRRTGMPKKRSWRYKASPTSWRSAYLLVVTLLLRGGLATLPGRRDGRSPSRRTGQHWMHGFQHLGEVMPWQRQLPEFKTASWRTHARPSLATRSRSCRATGLGRSLAYQRAAASDHLCRSVEIFDRKPALDRPIFGVVRHHRLCLHALNLYRIGRRQAKCSQAVSEKRFVNQGSRWKNI